jgi:hypothetical protein
MSCFRGMQGSGAIFAGRYTDEKKKKEKILVSRQRKLVTAAELSIDDAFVKRAGESDIIVTHARLPTKGETKVEMLHPHVHENIFGVHNGTMYRVDDRQIPDNESDSAAIMKALSEKGVQGFLDDSYGAFSLVWVDLKTGTLNFFRNDQRPMVFAEIQWKDKSESLYWASEEIFLRMVLHRDLGSLDGIEFANTNVNELISFPLKVGKQIEVVDKKTFTRTTKVYQYQGRNHGDDDIYGFPFDPTEEADWQKWLRERDEKERKSMRALPPPLSSRPIDNVTQIAHRLQSEAAKKRSETFREAMRARREREGGLRTDQLLGKTAEEIASKNRTSVLFPADTTENGMSTGEITRLLGNGCCVICDGTPSWKNGNPPRIHPIKMDAGYQQFICDDCSTNELAKPFLGSALTNATLH